MKRVLVSILLFLLGAVPALAAPTASGQQAVQIAQRQLGTACQDVTLPGYHVWGRHTNGCADLVVAVEANAGCYKPTPGDAWVATFEKAMLSQGWKAIPRPEARPGDVAIFHASNGEDQHTEIVVSDGATQLIGNNGNSQETVSYDSGNWGNPTFYTPAQAANPHLLEARVQQIRVQVEALEAQVVQVKADRSQLQNQASNVQEWYQEGAISQRQAEGIQRQAREQGEREKALSASLAKAQAQLSDAATDLKRVEPSRVALALTPTPKFDTTVPTRDAYWQSLYDQGAISRKVLEQHSK